MSQNSELGKLAQYLLVNASSNTISFTNNTSSVGIGNTSVTTAPIFTVANATSNLVITSSSISIGGTVVVNAISLPSPGVNTDAQYAFTNTTTFSNTITFSSLLNVGSNVVANTTSLFVGNSTVNAYYNQTGFIVANSTVTVNVGSLGIYVGSNTFINTTAFAIGNSTANAYMNLVGFIASNSTTSTVANTTGYYRGTINSTSIGSSLTNNALIIGNTSTQANITATTLAIGNTSNAFFYANSTGTGSPYYNSNSFYALYTTLGSVYVGGTLSSGVNQITNYASIAGVTYIAAGTLSLTPASAANNDIDLSGYISSASNKYHTIRVRVQGQYIANTNASQNTSGISTSNQSHLYKEFVQGVWANVAPTFVLEGGTVTASYNGDVTNFPAGAINATKVLLVPGAAASGQIFLRLIQRTTPAAQSATYYTYIVEILSY